MPTIGIIANPASGKDIRRLVSYATTIDNREKVNIVKRITLAAQSMGIDRIQFMPDSLIRYRHVNMGLAVAKNDGLIVPNVKQCEEKSLSEIAQATERLIEAVRSGSITMEDITGGTFTITNLGNYGVTYFSPIINQPELAILGVCAMADTPVVRNGEVVIRPMMNLCLSADHRVIDGVMGAAFLKRVCELLENPCLLLL